MNIRILTPELECVMVCGEPKGEPQGNFSRFLHELGIEGTLRLGAARDTTPGVQPSVPGNWFCEGGKKG